MTKEIFIITKNKGKILAAQSVFSKFGIVVKNIEKDYPEIQANSSMKIAKYAVEQAGKDYNLPIIREDHSLFIKALGGFPGPYTSYFDKIIPAEKILELISTLDKCEFARYAPASESGEMKSVYENAIAIITTIEEEVR